MNAQSIGKAMQAISEIMAENRDYLIQLDQQNGDGDLGVYMSAGFAAVAADLASGEDEDMGRLFMRCSAVLNENAPSSLGTILSFGLIGMARALKGTTEPEPMQLALAMEAGLQSIMERAKSKPGEKTVLDALCPGVEMLKTRLESGDDLGSAMAAAAAAAAEGSESTKNMRSVHGRAAYYAEKSIGILDGGSVAGKLIFEALTECCG